jgi:predicted nucleic acid-binding protein
MMYLLDTNVISELRKAKSGKCNQQVMEWAATLSSSSLYVSVMTILELEIGVLSIEKRDSNQGALLRYWLDFHVIPTFSGKVIPIDMPVVKCCASLHVPNPCSDRDALIAATALVHKMTVVTRNTKDFELTGVELLNPWEDVDYEKARNS